MAALSSDLVTSCSAGEFVVATAAKELIGTLAAEDRVLAALSSDLVTSCSAGELVGSTAAEEGIVSCPAADQIRAAASLYDIGSAQADNHVTAWGSYDVVLPGRADDRGPLSSTEVGCV